MASKPPTALAPTPGKATTSITLSVAGLFNIPLSVYTATEETRVTRKEFIRVQETLVPVGRSATRKDTNEVIDSVNVIRMAESTKGAWVVLTDDEIADCTTVRGLANVEAFVKHSQAHHYLVEGLLQVRPKAVKGVVNPAEGKAFFLLLTALAERKVYALVKVAMRGPARYALLDEHGNLFLVKSADQVRAPRPIESYPTSLAERAMACTLIDAVGIDAPTLFDTTAPEVQKFVDAKAIGAAPAPEATPVPQVDLMAALEASIAAAQANKAQVTA